MAQLKTSMWSSTMLRRFCVLFCLFLWILSAIPAATQGNGGAQWERSITISNPAYFAHSPTLVADQMGQVHLFWTEALEVDESGRSLMPALDVLVYRQWREGIWTEPVDVLASPDNAGIWQSFAAADGCGVLHVVWVSRANNLFYASVPVASAMLVHAWSPPMQIATGLPTSQLPAAIAVDSQNALHIIYTTRDVGSEVVHIVSQDGGVTWAAEVSVSAAMQAFPQPGLVSSSVALNIDTEGGLHVGWTMVDGEGFGVAVLYSASKDGGQTWTPPMIVGERATGDYEADWLSIATVDAERILLVWAGIGMPPGRSYRFSSDGGLTWTEPTHFMQGLGGETEAIRMVVDRAGVVHLLTPARTTDSSMVRSSGVRYVYWTGSAWSAPQLLLRENPEDQGGLATSATIRLGNEIFVAWHNQIRGSVELSRGITVSPALSPQPFAACLYDHEQLPEEPQDPVTDPSAEPTSVPLPDINRLPPVDTQQGLSAILPVFLLPTGLIVLMLIGVFGIANRKNRR